MSKLIKTIMLHFWVQKNQEIYIRSINFEKSYKIIFNNFVHTFKIFL